MPFLVSTKVDFGPAKAQGAQETMNKGDLFRKQSRRLADEIPKEFSALLWSGVFRSPAPEDWPLCQTSDSVSFHSLLFQHCVAVLLPLLGCRILSMSGGAALGDLALECLDHWSIRTSKHEGTHCPSFRDPHFEVGQDLGVVSLKKGEYFLQKSRVFLVAKWCAEGRCKLLARDYISQPPSTYVHVAI